MTLRELSTRPSIVAAGLSSRSRLRSNTRIAGVAGLQSAVSWPPVLRRVTVTMSCRDKAAWSVMDTGGGGGVLLAPPLAPPSDRLSPSSLLLPTSSICSPVRGVRSSASLVTVRDVLEPRRRVPGDSAITVCAFAAPPSGVKLAGDVASSYGDAAGATVRGAVPRSGVDGGCGGGDTDTAGVDTALGTGGGDAGPVMVFGGDASRFGILRRLGE